PVWKRCGVYLWSIPYRGAFLASYPGQCRGAGRNFDRRIWEEYKWWKKGCDHALDIEQYKMGRRCEIGSYPAGHLERELSELTPILRLWLMPLDVEEEFDQAERWLVAELCKTALTRQFLANRNPESYKPDPSW